MITPIRFILDVLQGQISTATEQVPVIKDPTPNDRTPCITIDNSSGTGVVEKHITYIDSEQVIREERTIDLDLNIWCDSEDDRDTITNNVRECFFKLQSDHYTYCVKYNDGDCLSLEAPCRAIESNSFRGLKNQCPKPYDYEYMNLFTKHHIIRSTFDVTPPYILDDMSTTPITLRSIIRVSFSYYDYYNIGGERITNLSLNEELT